MVNFPKNALKGQSARMVSEPNSAENAGQAVLTLRQAAEHLQVSEAHLSNLINGKVKGVPKLPFARVGRRVLFKRQWGGGMVGKGGWRFVLSNGSI